MGLLGLISMGKSQTLDHLLLVPLLSQIKGTIKLAMYETGSKLPINRFAAT
jgi:hypothetical protein